jgi:hemoglobin
METTLFDEAGGSDAMLRIADAWHQRCLADEVLSHPFSHPGQHPDHIARLAAYLGEALGGPPTYTATIADQSHVVRLHSGNGEHLDLDRRAVKAFAEALDDAGIPDADRLHARLTAYFAWATTDLAQHPDSADDVPDGLPVPHWSRGGLVG